MIADKDRADWFGASDTSMIMGNWNTKTFMKWWMKKIGIDRSSFSTIYTQAGTHWEHRILEDIGILKTDRQIVLPQIRLRVNLDGETDKCVYEVKTYKHENGYKMSKAHTQQVRVQMYATHKEGKIVAYGLCDKDYKNYLRDIDADRLQIIPVEQDNEFIAEYLMRINYLADCLSKGAMPNEKIYRNSKQHSQQSFR